MQGVMSTVAAKRGRRKNLKPKLSFGSSSGASSDLPSVLEEDEAKEHQHLTESNVTDIRRVLQENGPFLEEDLLITLVPEQARQVPAEYDMLTSFMDPHPGFRQLHEGLLSFIYHEDPDYDGDRNFPSCHTVPLADLCDGLSTMALGAKMAVIAGGETGKPAYGAGGSVSMQKNKVNAAGDCGTSPCRYLPEVDTDDAVKIWCSRSQPSQVTHSGPRAFLVEGEQARSSTSGSGYDGLDDEEQDEEGSSQIGDGNSDRLCVDLPVGVKEEDRALEHQPLTESNGSDIISHMLAVLEENGPSLEEEQPTKQEPEKARRVLAEHDSFLVAPPRIHTAT